MKNSFCQNGIAGEQRLGNLPREIPRPSMMLILAIPEGHQKTCICYSFHLREKPFLVDKFAGPSTSPASLRNG